MLKLLELKRCCLAVFYILVAVTDIQTRCSDTARIACIKHEMILMETYENIMPRIFLNSLLAIRITLDSIS
jgi:hypothetical protein